MANRTRTHRNEFHLNDDESYILGENPTVKRKTNLHFCGNWFYMDLSMTWTTLTSGK